MPQPPLAVQSPTEIITASSSIEIIPTPLNIAAEILRIEEAFNSNFIPTEHASDFFRQLNTYRLLKQCARIIGPRKTGKSRASYQYTQDSDGKIAYVKAPSNCSSKILFTRILQAINHAAKFGKRQDLRPRTAGSLEAFGYEMVIVDNADNLQKEALLDLNDLHEDINVPVALVATPDLDESLENYDLLNCFPNLYLFESLTEDDLRKTLNTIESVILKLPETSNLATGQNFETLVTGSHAHIGKLIKVIHTAAFRSLEKGFRKIDSKILKKVVERHGVKYRPPRV